MKATIIHLDPRAIHVVVDDAKIHVTLADQREICVPLAWSPRLQRASVREREHYELIAEGRSIYWSAVDEDIDVRALLGLEAIVVPPDEDLSIHVPKDATNLPPPGRNCST